MTTGRFVLCGLLVLAFHWPGSFSRAAENVAGMPPAAVDYMVIVTGGELLIGAFPDAHTFFLTRTLRPLGLRCVGSMSVDDRADDIKAALQFAGERARLVIVTGGLGPTENDITRETLAEFTGIPLAENEEVLSAIERRLGVPRDRIRSNIRRQTRVPTRGTYLNNGDGSAVGLIYDWNDRVIVALPGPPSELQPMVRNALVPWLAERFGTRLPGASLTVRFVGLGQSLVDQTMQEHFPLDDDVILQSQFEAGRVDFTFSLPDDTADNRGRLQGLKEKILEHLGDCVYAVDETTLEQSLIRRFADRRQTLALAEAGSGGAVASALAGADGADRVLAGGLIAGDEKRLGWLVEADEQQLREAPSDESRVAFLAASVAEHFHGDWGLAVGQMQRAEDGSRYVNVAIQSPDGRTISHRLGTRGTDAGSRAYLTTRLLDLLRKQLP